MGRPESLPSLSIKKEKIAHLSFSEILLLSKNSDNFSSLPLPSVVQQTQTRTQQLTLPSSFAFLS
jgi:hypothetical protein